MENAYFQSHQNGFFGFVFFSFVLSLRYFSCKSQCPHFCKWSGTLAQDHWQLKKEQRGVFRGLRVRPRAVRKAPRGDFLSAPTFLTSRWQV